MNIVLATDHNFIVHCATTIMSIVANNDRANIYVLTDYLNHKDVDTLENVVKHNDSSLFIIEVNKDLFKDFPMPSIKTLSHISLATYYRLYVAELLPKSVDKVIYLDCDIVVRKSMMALWETDISGYALAAVYQNVDWNFERACSLGYSAEFGYFNAGVLLMNLTYWRENNVLNTFIEFIKQKQESILYHDQDVLNGTLFSVTKRLPARWNMLTDMFRKRYLDTNEYNAEGVILHDHQDYKADIIKESKDPYVIHFVSRPKPWANGCKHPWKREYGKYRKMAGFKYHESIKDKLLFMAVEFLRYLDLSPYFK